MASNAKQKLLSGLERGQDVEMDTSGGGERYMVTFPFPYMNGRLHLGHLFTILKCDFVARYKALRGYDVFFPFAFHGTGMPIAASAQRIKEEAESNLVGAQTEILLSMHVDRRDIAKFSDPVFWLRYFPPLAIADLTRAGVGASFRDSFVTTSINAYFDHFVRWQTTKLMMQGLIYYGKKPAIFSMRDNQPCADHDRSVGEGVQPVHVYGVAARICDADNTLLIEKFQNPPSLLHKTGNIVCHVYQPEQAAAVAVLLVDPDREYTIVSRMEDEYCIMSYSEAQCLAAQDFCVRICGTCIGNALVGMSVLLADGHECQILAHTTHGKISALLPTVFSEDAELCRELSVQARQSMYRGGRMLSRKSKKKFLEDTEMQVCSAGTAAEQRQKIAESYRIFKFYIPEDVVVSRTGEQCIVKDVYQWLLKYSDEEWKYRAVVCLERMAIDARTKELIVQAVGWMGDWGLSRSFGLGSSIPWDKDVLIESLSDSSLYMAFYTVVRMMAQDIYGSVEIFPKKFLCYAVFEFVFGSYSVDDFLASVDALFLYNEKKRSKQETVAALRALYNAKGLPFQMSVEDSVLEAVSEGVLFSADTFARSTIGGMGAVEYLVAMRERFASLYPVDIRITGKDLLKNHIVFSVFAHVALLPEKFWPVSFFANGHLLINEKKMSKSEGTFVLVCDALDRYPVSALRGSLALAGDSLVDANFDTKTLDSVTARLVAIEERLEHILPGLGPGKYYALPQISEGVYDEVGLSYLRAALCRNACSAMEHFEKIEFRAGTIFSFFEMCIAKDLFFRIMSSVGDRKKLADGYRLFLRIFLVLNAPIFPHFSACLYSRVFGKNVSEEKTLLDEVSAPAYREDSGIEYIEKVLRAARALAARRTKNTACTVRITVFARYPEYKEVVIDRVRNGVSDRRALVDEIGRLDISEKQKKTAIQFAAILLDGRQAAAHAERPFDEYDTLKTFLPYIDQEMKRNGISASFDVEKTEQGAGEPFSPVITIIDKKDK